MYFDFNVSFSYFEDCVEKHIRKYKELIWYIYTLIMSMFYLHSGLVV